MSIRNFRAKPKRSLDHSFFQVNFPESCPTDGFIYGSVLEDIETGRAYIAVTILSKMNCCVNNTMLSAIEIDPNTVGRDTGRTDKHGLSLYDGDVIKVQGFSNYFAKIEYCNGEYVIVNDDIHIPRSLSAVNSNFIEKVGNVYDNPDWNKAKAWEV